MQESHQIFQELYGIALRPRELIDAFSSIRTMFRSKICLVMVFVDFTEYKFNMPNRHVRGKWIYQEDREYELDMDFVKRLDLAIASNEGESSDSVIDVACGKCPSRGGNEFWGLLYSFSIRRASGLSEKRMPGSTRLFFYNEGFAAKCHYKDRVSDNIDAQSDIHHHDVFALYITYFDQMLRDLSFVPMPMIKAEWDKALYRIARVNSGEARHRAGLPWGEDAPRETPTVTLSLDLRKSTFAMQQTRDRRGYASWLESVAELAREITLQNGGIFDKFTGDGVICHFVYPAEGESKDEGKDQALHAAMSCAVELIRAMRLHICDVLSQLKFTSGAFGPAVGMAVDMATWSLDRDGKPVVVGPGIVNACRLNGGDAGQIILTNDLKHMVSGLVPGLNFEQHPLGETHKDFPAAMKAECWRMTGFEAPVGRSDSALLGEVVRVRKVLER